MGHRIMGWAHAQLLHSAATLRSARGQGTVEYVALILLVAGVLAAVVSVGKGMRGGGIAEAIIGKLKQSIEAVGKPGS